ncbi:hypothetical protein CBR_g54517 [Chara braunii]|uniref:ATP-dependent DNA helicase n=1 Tax=Chara braunii TaxID=69332 RepID=A0A388MCD4_CHABU|nr:hypothetical protein CBR_g54517 [Chara braunii]|eukprot:GBG92165.1 hypothetical protein CBR_g54517 [Chara braunii]
MRSTARRHQGEGEAREADGGRPWHVVIRAASPSRFRLPDPDPDPASPRGHPDPDPTSPRGHPRCVAIPIRIWIWRCHVVIHATIPIRIRIRIRRRHVVIRAASPSRFRLPDPDPDPDPDCHVDLPRGSAYLRRYRQRRFGGHHGPATSRSGIALTVASSGIAATLLTGGRTFHFRFHAPLKPDNTRPFLIAKQSDLAELIRRADLIVWDEAPMSNKFHLEALDITLRNLCNNDEPFGDSRMPHKYDTRAKRKAMTTSNTTQYDTNITSKVGAEHSEKSKKSGNDEMSVNLGSEHAWDDHPILREVERERSQQNTLDDAEKMVVEGDAHNCCVDGDGSYRGQSGRLINLTFHDLEDDNVTDDSKGDLVESTLVRKKSRRAKTNVLDSPRVSEPTLNNNRVERQPVAHKTGTQILRAINQLPAEALASLEFCAPLAGRARVLDSCSQFQHSGRERDVCVTSQPQNRAGVIVVSDDKHEPAIHAPNPRAYLGKWFEDAKKVGIQNVLTELLFEMFVKSAIVVKDRRI